MQTGNRIGQATASDLNAVVRLVGPILNQRLGLHLREISPQVLALAVAERMAASHINTLSGYATRLRTEDGLLFELAERVVVVESWFYRDPEAFRLLAEDAARRFTGRSLRLLSLPCAAGQEPYTAAMTLLDAGFASDRFRIDAVDINDAALRCAATAQFGRGAFRSDDLSFRDRYFTSLTTGAFQLRPEVTDSVCLKLGNVLDMDWREGAELYDYIFCRNLLIYLLPEARELALNNLQTLLAEDGLLFVGPAEVALCCAAGFLPADHRHAFALHGAAGADTVVQATAGAAGSVPSVRAPRVTAPAPPVDPAEPLHRARQLADGGHIDAALGLVQQSLSAGDVCPDSYALLGVLHAAGNHWAEAERALARAVYLDPHHVESLYHLALLCERRGDTRGAQRYRNRIERTQTLSREDA